MFQLSLNLQVQRFFSSYEQEVVVKVPSHESRTIRLCLSLFIHKLDTDTGSWKGKDIREVYIRKSVGLESIHPVENVSSVAENIVTGAEIDEIIGALELT